MRTCSHGWHCSGPQTNPPQTTPSQISIISGPLTRLETGPNPISKSRCCKSLSNEPLIANWKIIHKDLGPPKKLYTYKLIRSGFCWNGGRRKKNSLVKGAIIAEIGRVSFCFAASFGYNFCSLSLFLTLFLFLRHVYQSVSFSQYS